MNIDTDFTWPEFTEDIFHCNFQIPNSFEENQLTETYPTQNINLLQGSKKIRKAKFIRENQLDSPLSQKDGKNNKNRNFWRAEEDAQVIELYNIHGPKWATIASIMKTRTRKQIRDRYVNSLRPDINDSEWTQEEENLFAVLYKKYGNKWCKIAAEMAGRTENQVKNKFYYSFHKPEAQKHSKTGGSKKSDEKENMTMSPETQFTDEFFVLSSEDESALQHFNINFKDSFEEINLAERKPYF